MIRIARLLEKQKMQSRMLLQVHDELVFEAPPSETDRLQELVKTEMERVYEDPCLWWPILARDRVGGMQSERRREVRGGSPARQQTRTMRNGAFASLDAKLKFK